MARRLHLIGDMDTNGSQTLSSSPATQAPALEVYDLVILGDGTGSTLAAWTFASKGQRVAVIERKYIGGSCPNIACLPSKNILQSARVASYFRRGEEFGMFAQGFRVEMPAVLARKRADGIGPEQYLSRAVQADWRGIHSRIGTLRSSRRLWKSFSRAERLVASVEPM